LHVDQRPLLHCSITEANCAYTSALGPSAETNLRQKSGTKTTPLCSIAEAAEASTADTIWPEADCP